MNYKRLSCFAIIYVLICFHNSATSLHIEYNLINIAISVAIAIGITWTICDNK